MALDHNTDVQSVTPVVSVIIPARNEEACLERCLRSLVEQVGVPFELILVDDGSTDRTAEIMDRFAGIRECPFLGENPDLVRIRHLSAPALPKGWTGKSNAAWSGAEASGGAWLLFTDADTVHFRGSLARTVAEAHENDVVLLSYSPYQEIHSLGERMLMPLIFGELAENYPPRRVSDPGSPIAAANGQYLLIRRDVYYATGGHNAVAADILEDVAIAKRVKQSGGLLRFRFGGDQVKARMYRCWGELIEGWTKNLALLFKSPGTLAIRRLFEFACMWGSIVLAFALGFNHSLAASIVGICALVLWFNFFMRVGKAHSGITNTVLSTVGLPVFAWLLFRSRRAHSPGGNIRWKGRSYPGSASAENPGASIATDPSNENGRASHAEQAS